MSLCRFGQSYIARSPGFLRALPRTGLDSSGIAHQKHIGARVSELDGLRGIAILVVLLYHFAPLSGPLHFLLPVLSVGWIGVNLFFVLSGYLITGILLDSVGQPAYYRNFIVRRSLRIFPLYYASLVLYAVLISYPHAVRWADFVHARWGWYLVYLGNVKVFLDNYLPPGYILTPLWSLQVEEQFYLTFPLLVYVVSRATLKRILVGSMILAFALRIALTFGLPGNHVGTYALMPCRMDALALGGLIALLKREDPERLKGRWIGWLSGLAGATFVCICLIFTTAPESNVMRTIGFTTADVMFAGVLIMMVSWQQPALLALCRRRFLIFLGTISYGLYLLHIPAKLVARHFTRPFVTMIPLNGSVVLFISLAGNAR
jgi:peptidoglycan/LPS O-acetylase OafA/YrhL